jgi:hypothetical protein
VPDRDSEGDIEAAERIEEGEVTISLLLRSLGIGIEEGFTGTSMMSHRVNSSQLLNALKASKETKLFK